ncbi:hypothetical protein [Burkholderia seminalis]|uniref:hypothetical protein n=1 Tax=Burkholderia seminalis TaxID=488731 RepID=UPI00158CEFB2|nr:hypothetical protein [Burkholderia seminalis]
MSVIALKISGGQLETWLFLIRIVSPAPKRRRSIFPFGYQLVSAPNMKDDEKFSPWDDISYGIGFPILALGMVAMFIAAIIAVL